LKVPVARTRIIISLIGLTVLATVSVVVIRRKVIEGFQDVGAALFVQYLKEDYMPTQRHTMEHWPATLDQVGQDLAAKLSNRNDERSRVLFDTFQQTAPALTVTRADDQSLDGIVTFHWSSGRIKRLKLHTRADFYEEPRAGEP
jgi:hypothetical protein